MYTSTWPIGTCHFNELPNDIQQSLLLFISDGGASLTVHRTATEGPYIEFAGWKVRVTIETSTPSTFVVRLA